MRTTVSSLNPTHTTLVAKQGVSWFPLSEALTLQMCSPTAPPPSCEVLWITACLYPHLCHPWVFLSPSLSSPRFSLSIPTFMLSDSMVFMSDCVLATQTLNLLTSSVSSILPYVPFLTGRSARWVETPGCMCACVCGGGTQLQNLCK